MPPPTQILPDMRELDGWVYSSEPLWVQVGDEALTVRRLRERVSPDGRMERTVHDEILHRVSPDRLELEAEEAGLRRAGQAPDQLGPQRGRLRRSCCSRSPSERAQGSACSPSIPSR